MSFDVTWIRGGIENAYLLTGEKVVLVDTLAPKGFPRLEKALAEKGLSMQDIELVLLTHHHFDHIGNLARIKESSGATVVAGAADTPFIDGKSTPPAISDLNRVGRFLGRLPESWLRGYQRCEHAEVDLIVAGGESIEELGLEVLALPGHTPGGVGFYNREGKRAFVGDLVSNYFGKPGMPVLSASESLQEIFASQALLAGLGLDIAYPGHGRIITEGASEKIGEMSRKKQARLASGSSTD